ncbi:MAG: hypothetical protein ACOX9E_07590 [Lentisphaeria bacterium]|jgi:hypothetical protein
MTPREAVDIYRKNVKNNEIDSLYQSRNFFIFFTEKDRAPIRDPGYYVNKNTGALINAMKFSPEAARAWKEGLDEGAAALPPIPASEYL